QLPKLRELVVVDGRTRRSRRRSRRGWRRGRRLVVSAVVISPAAVVLFLLTLPVLAIRVSRSANHQRCPAASASTHKSHCVLLILTTLTSGLRRLRRSRATTIVPLEAAAITRKGRNVAAQSI